MLILISFLVIIWLRAKGLCGYLEGEGLILRKVYLLIDECVSFPWFFLLVF